MENQSRAARASKKAYEQLRNSIIQGYRQPGEKLPPPETLASELRSTHAVVRRALRRLTALGFLENRPGDGVYVKTIVGNQFAGAFLPFLAYEKTTILQVLEYRWMIEKGAASIAAKKADDDDIRDLEAAYRKMEADQNSAEAFALRDLEFHRILAQATHNPVIVKVNSAVRGILEASVLELVSCLGVNDALFYHERILQAVKERNRVEAERWMEEHIGRTIRRYLENDGKSEDGE